MQLWVGLGNPGAQYALHRHNVGFMAVDTIAGVHRFGPAQKKFSGWLHEGRIGTERVMVLKPATFMNESGRAVAEAMRFWKLPIEALTVFHDELDLAPMKVKVKRGGGHAGHNGLRSIDQHLKAFSSAVPAPRGSENATAKSGAEFRRVRLGIGHPGHKDRVTGYVLGPFAKAEGDALGDMLAAVAAEAAWLARGDDVRFMNDVAMRMQA